MNPSRLAHPSEGVGLPYPALMGLGGDEQWFVAQTKPRQEDRAQANLSTLGDIEIFLPLTKEPIRRRRHRVRIAPFFPGYIFVKCDLPAMLHRILYTRGVHRVLGTPNGPLPVDPQVIASIRERIGDDGLVRLEPSFKAGDAVRVTAGPLEDFRGVFQAYRNPAERAEILVRTLTGGVRALVDCDSLEAC